LIEPQDPAGNQDMPRADELLTSVRNFLREDVMAATTGRTQFLARVAGNSLDIVQRELALGAENRLLEQQRLARLLSSDATLADLRWQLVNALREGSIALDDPQLAAHLRTTVVNQIAIDQPRYSGFRTAQENSVVSA
jgi:hypothetical protein